MRLKRRLRLLAHALRGPGPGPTAATVTPARNAILDGVPEVPEGTPLVSAIILNRNGARLLEALFRSLSENEPYQPLEIILVDHASTDESLDVAQRWQDRLLIKVLARTENASFSFGNNRAVEEARGEYVLLLNNDIVFTEPVIGPMVAAAQHSEALVGLGQYDLPTEEMPDARDWHHIGVRWFWNGRTRCLIPRNQKPTAWDALINTATATMPAVTASIMLCRRDQYVRLGGLHEGYFYGYEDIDFCARFAALTGRPVLSLNGRTAFHGDGTTRTKTVAAKDRRERNGRNTRLMDSRLGYPLWRWISSVWPADDGSILGASPAIALPRELATRFGAGFGALGWQTGVLPRGMIRDFLPYSAILVSDPAFRFTWLDRRTPWLMVAGVCEDAAYWLRGDDLARFDVIFCRRSEDIPVLRERGAARVVLMPADDELAASLRDELLAARREGLRLAVYGRDGCDLCAELGAMGVTAWRATTTDDLDAADAVLTFGTAPPVECNRPVVAVSRERDIAEILSEIRTRVAEASAMPQDPPLQPAGT
jgi:GT2 family glycosyltransferase